MTPNGYLTFLMNFNVTNGANPYSGLTLGPDGNLYGTSYYGPSGNGAGLIYILKLPNQPPSIVAQPTKAITAPGNNASFTATLFGTAPYSCQWLSNNIPIADGTNNSLVISNVTMSSAGSFRVVISNAWGSVTSSVASLSVLLPPQSFSGQVVTRADYNFSSPARPIIPTSCKWPRT
jgi:hypothetical protein